MEFFLHYEGPLPATTTKNKRVNDKRRIRMALHPQLKTLWKQHPLNKYHHYIEIPPQSETFVKRVERYSFAPLVTDVLKLHAELSLTVLRPGPLTGILTGGGDLDNRLKTLFDALRCPQNIDELGGQENAYDDELTFCLLEDDRLISKLQVTLGQLLDPKSTENDVHILMRVRVKGSPMFGNVDFIV